MVNFNADWVITAVGSKDKEGKIPFYRSHLVWGEGDSGYLGRPLDISRSSMIRKIDEEGKRIITGRSVNGKMTPGENVRVTKAGYLRTDPNEIEEDNLGALPVVPKKRSDL